MEKADFLLFVKDFIYSATKFDRKAKNCTNKNEYIV